jgi:hypothetical protein
LTTYIVCVIILGVNIQLYIHMYHSTVNLYVVIFRINIIRFPVVFKLFVMKLWNIFFCRPYFEMKAKINQQMEVCSSGVCVSNL